MFRRVHPLISYLVVFVVAGVAMFGLAGLVLASPALAASGTGAGPGTGDAPEQQSVRLPGGVSPIAYKIFVEPDLEKGKFRGAETIIVSVDKPTRHIVLNAADLTIDRADCELPDRAVPLKLKVIEQAKREQLVLQAPERLSSKHCSIVLKFHGKLNNKGKGFFRSKFLDRNGKPSWIAATQMEPCDARRMFPCFDEPAYKATFSLSTSIDPSDVAISNAPVLTESIDSKTRRKIVTFDRTPKMSTYLVALVVGQFVSTGAGNACGVPVHIWCTPGKERLTAFGGNIAVKAFNYYKKYFDVPYPGKKLDLIAIPDFAFGAMENLGAITFREDTLLVDANNGSLDAKQQVAINVAHEIAHMWFGDLVTMKWWDDLWLNEAFAEWMSTRAVAELIPQWHYWNHFSLERDQSMMSDSLNATRAIHADVQNPAQIEEMFDEITYEKGASVLRMLERYVSEQKFRDGIRTYIKSHEFANATTNDLWTAIAAQSGKDVPHLMHSWIYQEGFPIITENFSNNQCQLEQSRFLFKKEDSNGGRSDKWEIPLTVRTLSNAGSRPTKLLLSDQRLELSIAGSIATPLILNAGGEGYYRVRYTPNALHCIAENIDRLTPLERTSILSDCFYLAISGKIPVTQYMQFAECFKSEENPAVISLLCSHFNQLNLMIEDAAQPAFADYVCRILSNSRDSLAQVKSSEPDIVKDERAEVLLALGTIGKDEGTIDDARTRFDQYMNDKLEVEPNLLDATMKIVAFNGSADDFVHIEAMRQNAKTPERAESALMALGMFSDPTLVQRTLKMSLSGKVEKQDGPQLFAQVMGTRAGRSSAWHFMRKHIIRIAWRFPDHLLPNIVMAMNSLASADELSQVQAFFKKHPVPSQARGINKIIEAIQIRVAFRERNGKQLTAWLNANAAAAQVKERREAENEPLRSAFFTTQ